MSLFHIFYKTSTFYTNHLSSTLHIHHPHSTSVIYHLHCTSVIHILHSSILFCERRSFLLYIMTNPSVGSTSINSLLNPVPDNQEEEEEGVTTSVGILPVKPDFKNFFSEDEVKAMGERYVKMINDSKRLRKQVYNSPALVYVDVEAPKPEDDKGPRAWKQVASEECKVSQVFLALYMRIKNWEPEMKNDRNRLTILAAVWNSLCYGVPGRWCTEMKPKGKGWLWECDITVYKPTANGMQTTVMQVELEVLDMRT